jgi:hypothetical protein
VVKAITHLLSTKTTDGTSWLMHRSIGCELNTDKKAPTPPNDRRLRFDRLSVPPLAVRVPGLWLEQIRQARDEVHRISVTQVRDELERDVVVALSQLPSKPLDRCAVLVVFPNQD